MDLLLSWLAEFVIDFHHARFPSSPSPSIHPLLFPLVECRPFCFLLIDRYRHVSGAPLPIAHSAMLLRSIYSLGCGKKSISCPRVHVHHCPIFGSFQATLMHDGRPSNGSNAKTVYCLLCGNVATASHTHTFCRIFSKAAAILCFADHNARGR